MKCAGVKRGSNMTGEITRLQHIYYQLFPHALMTSATHVSQPCIWRAMSASASANWKKRGNDGLVLPHHTLHLTPLIGVLALQPNILHMYTTQYERLMVGTPSIIHVQYMYTCVHVYNTCTCTQFMYNALVMNIIQPQRHTSYGSQRVHCNGLCSLKLAPLKICTHTIDIII